jgi:GNAT superfamily N-acetyltransferase
MDKQIQVRRAAIADAEELGRLLVEFNAEFEEPAPGVEEMARRCRRLLEAEEMLALLAEEGAEPVGLAVLRVRPGLWVAEAEAYLQELYVAPRLRGRGKAARTGRRCSTTSGRSERPRR